MNKGSDPLSAMCVQNIDVRLQCACFDAFIQAMSWIGVLNCQIVFVYWFVDPNGRNVSVNQHNYLDMLRDHVYPAIIQKFGTTDGYWFQQVSNNSVPHQSVTALR